MAASGCAHGEKESKQWRPLCPGYVLKGEIDPGLSDVEKRLICGDTEDLGAANEGWQEIPRNQAGFHLRTFLQKRGYLNPKITEKSESKPVQVEPGEKTRVTQILAEGLPEGFRLERRREVVGEMLTPELLTETERWIYQQLQGMGYPCPEVQTTAMAKTGEIRLKAIPGSKLDLVRIEEEKIPGLVDGILRRYDAFRLGQPYNELLLSLTANRVVNEGVVEDTYFSPTCTPEGAIAKQNVIVGPPRLVTLGFGVNTEELALLRARWSNNRLGPTASQLVTMARASMKVQSLEAYMNWFYLPRPAGLWLKPLVEVSHQNEDRFQLVSGRLHLAHGMGYDDTRAAFQVEVGPEFELLRTFRGEGEGDARFLSLRARAVSTSHLFEYYRTSPRDGFFLAFDGSFAHQSLASAVTAQRLSVRGEGLYNVNDFDPPWLVLGIRGGASTTLTGKRPGESGELPPTFVNYLGGAANIRGFGRNELPANESGGLSSLYGGFELRANTLPWGLQPFGFLDAGAVGSGPASLDLPVYLAPGGGMRWQSPVGVFRGTAAHGYTVGSDPGSTPKHWQFFVTFGEEF